MKQLLDKLKKVASLKREITRLKKTILEKEEIIDELDDQINFLITERNKYKYKNISLRRELDILKATKRKEEN